LPGQAGRYVCFVWCCVCLCWWVLKALLNGSLGGFGYGSAMGYTGVTHFGIATKEVDRTVFAIFSLHFAMYYARIYDSYNKCYVFAIDLMNLGFRRDVATFDS
jgi:hypothetical protein